MNKKSMKWSAAILSAGLLVGNTSFLSGQSEAVVAAATSVQASDVVMKYNGKTLSAPGKLVNGSTMIPISVLRDDLGLKLSYKAGKGVKTYTVGSGVTQMKLEVTEYGINTRINDRYIGDNNTSYESYEAKNINGKLYVPYRVLKEYLGFQGSYNSSSKTLTLKKQQQNKVTITSETISDSNNNATIDIRYPKLSGLANAEAQEAINKTFKDKAEAFAAEAKKKAKDRDAEFEQPYEFHGTFLVTFNRDGVLSIATDLYEYVGGAHGMTYREGFTFSLKDGKQLTLDDLLHSSDAAKKKLDQMLQKETDADNFNFGFNGLKEDPDFYVSENGLTVFFQIYEITSYAMGFPTYTFSFADLLPKGTDPFAAAR